MDDGGATLRDAERRRADEGDLESVEWLRGLAAGGSEEDDDAVARLHALLLRAARAEVNRRAPRVGLTGPDIDELAYDVAADACLALVRKLPQFRGESRFTTWAYRFVVLEVSAALARRAARRDSVPLDAADWAHLPDRLGVDPSAQVEAAELSRVVRRVVDHELTRHQRRAFQALVLGGADLDVLAVQLGSTRGALYKTMFDARRKIRAALAANGFLPAAPVGGEGRRP